MGFRTGIGGEHDDRQMAFFQEPPALYDLGAGKLRHVHVDDRKIVGQVVGVEHGQRFFAIVRQKGLVACVFEQTANDALVHRIVFRDKNAQFAHRRGLRLETAAQGNYVVRHVAAGGGVDGVEEQRGVDRGAQHRGKAVPYTFAVARGGRADVGFDQDDGQCRERRVVAQQAQEGSGIARQTAAFDHHGPHRRRAVGGGGQFSCQAGGVVDKYKFCAPAAHHRLEAWQQVVASEDRHPHGGIEVFRFVRCGGGLHGKRQFEPESGALTFAAMQADLSAQRFDELLGDGGAEPAAAKTTGDGGVSLGEAVEDAGLRVLRYANAGVDHFKAQTLRLALADRTDVNVDAAVFGEFDGVANQVDDHLPQVATVAVQMERRLRRNVRGEHQSLALRLGFHHGDGAVDEAMQIEVFTGRREATGFDAGDVEHVVDQFEQSVGRGANNVREFLLFLIQPCFGQQVRDADHAVERCAQFVAHVGKERRFGLVGFAFAFDCAVQLFEQAG